MTQLVLLKPHTHAGKTCGAGERIEVDEASAQWLNANSIAKPAPTPVRPETEGKSEPVIEPHESHQPNQRRAKP